MTCGIELEIKSKLIRANLTNMNLSYSEKNKPAILEIIKDETEKARKKYKVDKGNLYSFGASRLIPNKEAFEAIENSSQYIREREREQQRENLGVIPLRQPLNYIKEGVNFVFEQNPDLANAVYEALGFKTKPSENEITRDIKEILPFKVIGNYSNIEEGLTSRRQYSTVIDGNNYVFDISTYSYENEDGTFQSYYDIDFTVNGSEDIIGTGFFDKSEKGKRIIQAIISQNYGNDTIRLNVEESKKGKQRLLLYKRLMNQLGYNPSEEMEYALFYDIKTDKVNLTPQQKQQAQQQYSQYLEQNPNGSVEQFKSWVEEFNSKKRTPLQPTKEQLKHIKPLPEKLIENINNWVGKTNKEILETLKLYGEVYSEDKEFKNVIEVLLDNISKIDFVKFKGIGDLENKNNQAEYDAETGNIYVNNIAYQPENINVEDVIYRTILHEYLHGYFLATLDNPKTKEEKELVEYINEAYDVLTFEYENTDNWYGFHNVHEFVSELLSNKDFRESEQVKKTGILNKILNFINQLFFKKYGKDSVEIKRNAFNKILESVSILNPSTVKYSERRGSLSNFISQKSQERLNQIKDVFNENPELSKIGTVEQYNSYLDTIFPDSKVKDIVYHGSDIKIEQFEIRKEPLIHFGTKKAALQRGNVLNQVILNIKDLQSIKDGMWFLGTDEGGLLKELFDRGVLTLEQINIVNTARNEAISNSYYEDFRAKRGEGEKAGALKLQEILHDKNIGFKYVNFSEDNGSISYAVPKPEEIHILGSKQDIEGFKEFINSQKEITSKIKSSGLPDLNINC